eukprot:3106380-Amphidinium_carterae.1
MKSESCIQADTHKENRRTQMGNAPQGCFVQVLVVVECSAGLYSLSLACNSDLTYCTFMSEICTEVAEQLH